jgi:uncharacterized membrane protein
MFTAAAVLAGLLAVVFASAGVDKFRRARRQVDTAVKLGIPWRRYRLIGVSELAASAGLLAGLVIAPIGVAAAIGLVLLMTGAQAFRVRVHDAAPFLLGDGMFIVRAAATAILRIASA